MLIILLLQIHTILNTLHACGNTLNFHVAWGMFTRRSTTRRVMLSLVLLHLELSQISSSLVRNWFLWRPWGELYSITHVVPAKRLLSIPVSLHARVHVFAGLSRCLIDCLSKHTLRSLTQNVLSAVTISQHFLCTCYRPLTSTYRSSRTEKKRK